MNFESFPRPLEILLVMTAMALTAIAYILVCKFLTGIYLLIKKLVTGKTGKAGAAEGYTTEEDRAALEEIVDNAEKELKRAERWCILIALIIAVSLPLAMWLLGVAVEMSMLISWAVSSIYIFVGLPLLRSRFSGRPAGVFFKFGSLGGDALFVCPECFGVLEDASVILVNPTYTSEGRERVTLLCHECRHKYEGVKILPVLERRDLSDRDSGGGGGGGGSSGGGGASR
ncbi:MAG: hypothetical protein LBB74_00085 [Chitinispirillales bacterium]|jgi:uncharacterized membrane protein YgcG|nr:hypothetical protein [Chitinispirillales bacterium]